MSPEPSPLGPTPPGPPKPDPSTSDKIKEGLLKFADWLKAQAAKSAVLLVQLLVLS